MESTLAAFGRSDRASEIVCFRGKTSAVPVMSGCCAASCAFSMELMPMKTSGVFGKNVSWYLSAKSSAASSPITAASNRVSRQRTARWA
jgi:hypothetical protein